MGAATAPFTPLGIPFREIFSIDRNRHSDERVGRTLSLVYDSAQDMCGGQSATYLPKRAGSPFAIAVCTVDGFEHAVGDADETFSLQAVANPLSFGFALHHAEERAVRRNVGVEPSGNPFHAILIHRRSNRPYTPLGNAGAIAIAGLIAT